jgi:hypothetical protein
MVTKVFNNGEPTVNNQSTVVRTGYAYVGPWRVRFYESVCSRGLCRQSIPADNTGTIIFEGGSGSARSIQKELGFAAISALAVAPFKAGG